MQKSYKINVALKVGTLLAVAVFATGCISAKSGYDAKWRPAKAAQPSYASGGANTWTVVSGNTLWSISANEKVYNTPYQWPLLYKANSSVLDDADLIRPGQVLDIPRRLSAGEVDAAIRYAKSRGSWSVGEVETSDQQYLQGN